MNIIISICARGGSKGIPGKNIKMLNGLPLIAYTIKAAKAFASKYPGTDIGLSTDSIEIKETAAAHNLSTDYLRPAVLGGDHVGKMGVLRHLMEYHEAKNDKEYDYLIDLDVTSPLRTLEDIENALKRLEAAPDMLNIFSVSPPGRNPYFNMVEEMADGSVQLVKKPEKPFMSRQEAPAVYDMNASIYVFRRACFTRKLSSSITERSLAYLMEHLCFDLDNPLDFEIMNFLLRENKLDFKLCGL